MNEAAYFLFASFEAEVDLVQTVNDFYRSQKIGEWLYRHHFHSVSYPRFD
jgi:hypothetical protein